MATGYRRSVGERLWCGMSDTGRITEKDVEVLEFVARYGVVPREVVKMWAGSGRSAAAARERRLREAGLIEVRPGFGGGRLVVCRRGGLKAVGREELAVPRLSPATVRHDGVAARVGAGLERAGLDVLCEREIEARERAEAGRVLSAPRRGGGHHRPDLVVLTATGPVAIEVGLTDKSARRLDALMRSWRRAVSAGGFAGVRYLCAPRALPYVERAVARTAGERAITVESLEGLIAAVNDGAHAGVGRRG